LVVFVVDVQHAAEGKGDQRVELPIEHDGRLARIAQHRAGHQRRLGRLDRFAVFDLLP